MIFAVSRPAMAGCTRQLSRNQQKQSHENHTYHSQIKRTHSNPRICNHADGAARAVGFRRTDFCERQINRITLAETTKSKANQMKNKTTTIKFKDAAGRECLVALANIRFDGKVIRGSQKIHGEWINRSILPSELSLDGMEKSVNYSYFSSNNAERFGLKDGGYCVAIGKPNKPAYSICGFASRPFADELFNALPIPASRFTLPVA